MKTIVMSVIISLLFIIGFNNNSYAQRWGHGDRDRDRGRVRANISIGTPNVYVRYGHYYRPRGYYYHTRYIAPRRVYYHRDYAERYWVPGYYDEWGYWVPGHWTWY